MESRANDAGEAAGDVIPVIAGQARQSNRGVLKGFSIKSIILAVSAKPPRWIASLRPQ